MKRDTKAKLSPTTIFLHWIVALTIIGLLASGVYMVENEVYALYDWHKSFGVAIVLFVFVRVVWRIINGWPEDLGVYKLWEKILARAVHYVLIIGSVLLPVSGMMMSALGGYGIEVFGFPLVAGADGESTHGFSVPVNKEVAGLASQAHTIIGYVLIACVVLHVVGAIKHEVIDKEGVLRRMLGA